MWGSYAKQKMSAVHFLESGLLRPGYFRFLPGLWYQYGVITVSFVDMCLFESLEMNSFWDKQQKIPVEEAVRAVNS